MVCFEHQGIQATTELAECACLLRWQQPRAADVYSGEQSAILITSWSVCIHAAQTFNGNWCEDSSEVISCGAIAESHCMHSTWKVALRLHNALLLAYW